MKLVVGGCVVLLATGVAFAKPNATPGRTAEEAVMESNLLMDVTCDNCERREEAMFSLGEMRSDRAVIPLMKVLHEGQTDQERIVAALALCLIGDGRGEYAVKRAARFDDSDRVRQTAAWFYNEYVRDGTFKFVPVQDADSYRMAQLMAQVREQR